MAFDLKTAVRGPIQPRDKKPYWPGFYERDLGDMCVTKWRFAYWDGLEWYQAAPSITEAKLCYIRKYKSSNVNRFWRGLAEKPEV